VYLPVDRYQKQAKERGTMTKSVATAKALKRRPQGLVALAAAGVATIVLAACGSTAPAGSSHQHSHAPTHAPATAPAHSPAPTHAPTTAPAHSPAPTHAPTTAPAHSANPIPQGNGGDSDADNNGGPSDGDGNI
jgi:uncharacterized membrane protein